MTMSGITMCVIDHFDSRPNKGLSNKAHAAPVQLSEPWTFKQVWASHLDVNFGAPFPARPPEYEP